MFNELGGETQRTPATAGTDRADDLAADGSDTRSSKAVVALPIGEERLICAEWIYFETS